MLKLVFHGQLDELQRGIDELAGDYGFERAEEGLHVTAEKSGRPGLAVERDGGRATIRYSKRVYFFRGLTLLMLAAKRNEERFTLSETPVFDTNGPMFDLSQGNAVLNVSSVKIFLRKMAMMGLDTLYMYAEDSYVVEGQPYFGYMRGKYTQEEWKEIDDYANLFGIEVIPCIQTLGHLTDVLRWPVFEDIKDDAASLLVGEEKTYEFIEQLIVSVMKPLRTRKIHLGLDEVWNLGLGNYLKKHGYRDKFSLMTEHLERVLKIVDKYGLKPMMWSDMFFRASAKNGIDYVNLETEISEEMIRQIPRHVQQVYWNYDIMDEHVHAGMLRKHKQMCDEPVYAGGIWNWHDYSLNYGKTFAAMNAALSACKKEGIRHVMATTWQSGPPECNIFAILLGLQFFAEHGFSERPDMNLVRERFEFTCGASYDDFYNIRLIDEVPGTVEGNVNGATTSKYLTWQNILQGLADCNIRGLPLADHYRKLRELLAPGKERNGEFGFIFEYYDRVCAFLELKSEMGLRITDAYLSGDRARLKEIAESELPELAVRLRALRGIHQEHWYRTYKPFGWDVADFRYGGLLFGIETAIRRIKDYLEGKIDRIEELEEPRLPFLGKEGLVFCRNFNLIASPSRLAR